MKCIEEFVDILEQYVFLINIKPKNDNIYLIKSYYIYLI